MNETLLILFVREIVLNVPQLAIEIIRILSKPEVTEADWDRIKASVAKSYDDYIKEAEARRAKEKRSE